MEMDEYIKINYKRLRQKVKAVTKNHQNSDDLFNDLLMNLLEKPIEYQRDLIENNKVENWLMSSAKLQFNSRTSPFFYKYKKFVKDTSPLFEDTTTTDDIPEDVAQEVFDFISSQLKLYSIYSSTLTREHLLEGKSYSQIGREYNINRKYISETITPVKEELLIEVKKRWNI